MKFSEIQEKFAIPDISPEEWSPLYLAYLGDNVYENINRVLSLSHGDRQVDKVNRECIARAKATTQAKIAIYLEDKLTKEEASVYRRGRNAAVHTKAKNASIIEYHQATGVEAVIGYLYLKGEEERILSLLQEAWRSLGIL